MHDWCDQDLLARILVANFSGAGPKKPIQLHREFGSIEPLAKRSGAACWRMMEDSACLILAMAAIFSRIWTHAPGVLT